MNRSIATFLVVAFFLVGVGTFTADAAGIVKTATTDGVRIELHVLPAEPFHTAAQVEANPDLEGMLVVDGAKPLAMDAPEHPNHHLIVHVFDAKSGKPLSDAKVKMKYQSVKDGKPTGEVTEVPVVRMQVIGKGPETTHYGNNVVLPAGTYAVTVVANEKKAEFDIDVPSGKEKTGD